MMNWAIGIDMHTLMCIKLMTNKNLLYKKINKIQTVKRKVRTKKKAAFSQAPCFTIITIDEERG